MAIITISRELAALGDETAHELAKMLNYRFVDKQSLEQRITSYGFNGVKLEKYDERKPSFWASLSQDRDDYLHYLKAALYTEAEAGNCVFVGRGANAIFREFPSAISIHLISPIPIRIERVKSYFKCDEKRAKQIIEQSDHDRNGFHRYFFDMDWSDPANYHLTINTGGLHPAASAKIIMDLKDLLIDAAIEKEALEKLKNMTLSHKIVHHILYDNKVPIHFLEAVVSNGAVVLHGVANSQASVEAAISGARELDSVDGVTSEIQVVQEYSVMP